MSDLKEDIKVSKNKNVTQTETISNLEKENAAKTKQLEVKQDSIS